MTDVKHYGHLLADARLEMLVGHLSDMLAPARGPMDALRLQANASVTTRGKLDLLLQQHGSLWKRLGVIGEEIRELRADLRRQA